MRTNLNCVDDTRNTAQAILPSDAVAQPLNERTADCASEVVQAKPRSKRAQAEAERRAKKKYAERWHKSVGGRGNVSDVRGHSVAPAFNRPTLSDWAPTYPEQKPHRQLGDRVPFASALSGWDPDRVVLEGYNAWTVP